MSTGGVLNNTVSEASITPLQVALHSRCPRCGEGKLYNGVLTLAQTCEHCGLDLQSQDTGDGPAFFVITLLGFLITGIAAYVEFAYTPPYWLHAVLWIPLLLVLTPLLLRFFKSYLVAMQYKVKLLEPEDNDAQ